MRSMWPGIDDNPGGSSYMVSNMRKRAIQASRFMLQMMQTPLYAKGTEAEDDNGCNGSPEIIDGPSQPSVECGEEGLAIRIATEVISLLLQLNSSVFPIQILNVIISIIRS